MNDSRIINVTQIRDFLKGSQEFDFSLRTADIEKKYEFIDKRENPTKESIPTKFTPHQTLSFWREQTNYIYECQKEQPKNSCGASLKLGITMPLENFGRPRSIRVDSVNQRNVYHINSVDEVTQ